jgi:hypothetical protein
MGPNGNIRGSDAEHVMLNALLEMLPATAVHEEQFKILSPTGSNYEVDIMVQLADGTKFLVEIDGPQHFRDRRFSASDPGSLETQLARDRYVEMWAISNGYSIFRVPDTLKGKAKQAKAFEYVLWAAAADFQARICQIHYLDFGKTFAKINESALENEDIPPLLVERTHHEPDVYISRTKRALALP